MGQAMNFWKMIDNPSQLDSWGKHVVSARRMGKEGARYVERHFTNGMLHRRDGPAQIVIDNFYRETCEEWYLRGEHHREDGPALIERDTTGALIQAEWMIQGDLHREDGPAVICGTGNGGARVLSWYLGGRQHREDGPAVIKPSYCAWYRYGKLHREGGLPALITIEDGYAVGYKICVNGQIIDSVHHQDSEYTYKDGQWTKDAFGEDGSIVWKPIPDPFGFETTDMYPLEFVELDQKLEIQERDT